MRYLPYIIVVALTLAFLGLGFWRSVYFWPLLITVPLAIQGTRDLFSKKHSLLRNYPLLAHFRWMIEGIRPEIRQYLLESDTEAMPFSREQRSLIYQRAKNVNDKDPFGTNLEVYSEGYEWLNHSIAAKTKQKEPDRIDIGNDQCSKPYSSSLLNISAMSFGSLSGNAIRALNKGAAKGGFAHDTGEGSVSVHHKEFGGDLIWEIGSGYFGCRADDGGFHADKFADLAVDDQIKMIEIKLSQGAKPGHGGVLPGNKVTPEIAEARGIPVGKDCISPSHHSAFSTPIEMLEFIAQLRDLSGGKPTGFKLCIGQHWEFMAVCKAMLETGIHPDFIVIDGAEGGTGAAPLELADHVGTPLREGLVFAQNALVGAGLREHVKLGVSGKISSGFRMASNMALGADWCNSARGFMFAVGCVQSQSCHTDRCPTGVATQNPKRARALVVPDKAERVYQYHLQTVAALSEVTATLGLEHPRELRPYHLSRRCSDSEIHTVDELYPWLKPGELLQETENKMYRQHWAWAQANSFQPAVS